MSSAPTVYSVNDVETAKYWSYSAWNDTTTDGGMLGKMISDGTLRLEKKLQSNPGDTVKFHFTKRLQALGLRGDATNTGNGSRLNRAQDEVVIDRIKTHYEIYNEDAMSRQRTGFDDYKDAYTNLTNWSSERVVVSVFNQLCGYYPTTITWDGVSATGDDRLLLTAFNTPSAPTSTRIYRPNALTTDQAINADTTATMKLSYVRECERLALKGRSSTTGTYMEPLSGLPTGAKFRMYVHIDQFIDMAMDTTAPEQFRDFVLAQIQGGGKKDALMGQTFLFSMTEIVAVDKIPNGVHSSTSAAQTNTRRAVFCGKNAGTVAFGKGFTAPNGDTTPGFKFNEDTIDIGEITRVKVSLNYGVTKNVIDTVDYGTIVVPTYVAQT